MEKIQSRNTNWKLRLDFSLTFHNLLFLWSCMVTYRSSEMLWLVCYSIVSGLLLNMKHDLLLKINFKHITMKSVRFLNHSTPLTMVWQVTWVVVYWKKETEPVNTALSANLVETSPWSRCIQKYNWLLLELIRSAIYLFQFSVFTMRLWYVCCLVILVFGARFCVSLVSGQSEFRIMVDIF